jgi:hypothetical protein
MREEVQFRGRYMLESINVSADSLTYAGSYGRGGLKERKGKPSVRLKHQEPVRRSFKAGKETCLEC